MWKLLLASLLLIPGPAHAEWIFNKTESAFAANPTLAIGVESGNDALAIMCQKPDTLALMFFPDPAIFTGMFEKYKSGNIKLLLRIDDGEIVRFDAMSNVFMDRQAVATRLTRSRLAELKSAKGRVSVALQDGGVTFAESQFDVLNVGSRIAELSTSCGI